MPLAEFINHGSDSALVNKLEHSSEVANYPKTACAAAVAANDIHHIHFNVKGHGFDKIHTVTESYYDKLNEEVDELTELAIEKGHNVPNLTLAGKFIMWPIQTELTYDYDSAVRAICKVLNTYINYLTALRDSVESDVSSKIDEYIRVWNKELHYKMEHRLESDTK
jgi:DNA-binding ferritin-like protein